VRAPRRFADGEKRGQTALPTDVRFLLLAGEWVGDRVVSPLFSEVLAECGAD
jgi:hypothetical protein